MKTSLFFVAITYLTISHVSASPIDENDSSQVREKRSPQQRNPGNLSLNGGFSPGSPGFPSQSQLSGTYNQGLFNGRGQAGVSAGHTKTSGQPSNSFARGEYQHRIWQGRRGGTLDAGGHYQRNWGQGPRHDYYGGLTLKVPIGRH